jgi:FkbM family methyltransferase
MISIIYDLYDKYKKKRAMRLFDIALKNLTKDSIAIDCGANVGVFTLKLANTKCKVYSFEPNHSAFEILKKNTQTLNNVKVFNNAVGIRNEKVKLFLHNHFEEDPIKWSTGSSIVSFKNNIDSSKFQIVDTIDFPQFIINLKKQIDILKIDIEGAEIELLNKIIDLQLYKEIKYIFVEVHDRKVPQLKNDTNMLRKKIKNLQIKNINLDWH